MSTQRSIAALLEAYGRELRRFLERRLRSPDAAADLAQETYLRVLRMPDAGKIRDFRGFLFTIASNLVRDHRRRQTRLDRRDGGPPDESIPCPAPSPEAVIEALEQAELLRQAIEALPDKTRTVFLMLRVEGRSYREIAAALQISPRTVEYHVRQALIHCRRRLGAAGDR